MSSVFRLAKKKQQAELRAALRRTTEKAGAARIESPLARYQGTSLSCVLCGPRVISPAAWPAHLNSRAHRQRAEEARKPPLKRPATRDPDPHPPPTKIAHLAPPEENDSTPTKKAEPEDPIPEGFFDDPIMDAKVRNIQYKDPIEEEWDKFQKEMKEETSLSAAIIAGEQEEATAERQIDEIEEQIRNLSKVLDLNKKKEEAAKQKALKESLLSGQDERSSDEDENFDEYLDWRAKKSYR